MGSSSRKLSGNAGTVMAYYRRDGLNSELGGLERVLSYYHSGNNNVAFHTGWGKLATTLGVTQGVTHEQFSELWAGRWNGQQLVRPGAHLKDKKTGVKVWKDRTSAVDVTFTSNKSHTEAVVRADPVERERLIAQFVDDVKTTFEKGIEGHARMARIRVPIDPDDPKSKTKIVRVKAELLAFPIVEYIARPTKEQRDRGSPVGDPHLHVHVLVMTLCQYGGRWYTADEYGVNNREAGTFRDAMLDNEITRNLEQSGYKINYSDFKFSKGRPLRWEIDGTDPALQHYWSTNRRRAEGIRESFERENARPMTHELESRIMAETRGRKSKADLIQDTRPAFDLWTDDAASRGFATYAIATQRYVPKSKFAAMEELRRRLLTSNGLHYEDSTFSGESIAARVMICGVGLGLSEPELEAYAAELPKTLILTRNAIDPAHRYYTTRMLLTAEAEVDDAVALAASNGRLLNLTGKAGTGKSYSVAAAIARMKGLEASPLDAEQAMVAGKVRELCGGQVDQVVVASMVGSIAERQAKKLHADRYGTIESLVHQVASGRLTMTDKTLVVLDESGMLDTLRARDLFKAVGAEPKIVMLGDTSQLGAIGASGWYSGQLETHGSIELKNVRRQKDPLDVRDADLIRNGKAPQALDNLAQRGRVHVAEDYGDRIAAVRADYDALRDEGVPAKQIRILGDASNGTVDALNRFVQYRLEAEGTISTTETVKLHAADSARSWTIHKGDQVIFAARYQSQAHDPVRNGTEGVVNGIDAKAQTITVALRDREVSVHYDEIADQVLQPAYAQHISRYQGHEVAHVLAMPGLAHSTRNSAYALMTRATDRVDVYLDAETHSDKPIEALGKAWQTAEDKRTARDSIRVVSSWDQILDNHLSPQTKGSDPHGTCAYRGVIAQRLGEQVAEQVTRSEHFTPLVERLDALAAWGSNAEVVLDKAIIRAGSAGADHCAAIRLHVDRMADELATLRGQVKAAKAERVQDFTPEVQRSQDVGLEL